MCFRWRTALLVSLLFGIPVMGIMIYFHWIHHTSMHAGAQTSVFTPALSLDNLLLFVLCTPVQVFVAKSTHILSISFCLFSIIGQTVMENFWYVLYFLDLWWQVFLLAKFQSLKAWYSQHGRIDSTCNNYFVCLFSGRYRSSHHFKVKSLLSLASMKSL